MRKNRQGKQNKTAPPLIPHLDPLAQGLDPPLHLMNACATTRKGAIIDLSCYFEFGHISSMTCTHRRNVNNSKLINVSICEALKQAC